MNTMQEFVTTMMNNDRNGVPDGYTMDDAMNDLRNWRVDEMNLLDGATEESLYDAMCWYIGEHKRLNAE